MQYKRILVSGGAGFIGSAVVRFLVSDREVHVINVDALTYAGDLSRLAMLDKAELTSHHDFLHRDICDENLLQNIFLEYEPDAVIHLAAQTHVDRSIEGPSEFVKTNVQGTLNMLEAARLYWQALSEEKKRYFRFVHVSTDEVYGDLADAAPASDELQCYAPNSPYAASKAAADHLVRAWYRTYGLPVVLTMGCNNYGAYQHLEKLIPHMVVNALKGRALPVYGDGLQKRQWLHVDDHVNALWRVLNDGVPGQSYHIATKDVIANRDMVRLICDILEEVKPSASGASYASLIQYVHDRPGHDRRYELDAGKMERDLGWKQQIHFEAGLRETVRWYVEHEAWWGKFLNDDYQLQRLGLLEKKGKSTP